MVVEVSKWEVVLVISTLIGIAAVVIPPIIKLTKAIVTLTCTVDTLKESMVRFEVDNTTAHRRLWEHNDIQDKRLGEYGTDIALLKGGVNAKTTPKDINM